MSEDQYKATISQQRKKMEVAAAVFEICTSIAKV